MNEFRKDADFIYVNVPYAEAYIPTELFTDSQSAVAYFYGDSICALGMFHMRFFKSEEEAKDRDKVELRTFKYPNMIETTPTDWHKEVLTLNGITDEYYVLEYFKGDVMMSSTYEKTVLSCEAFMDALTKAKLPETISYQDILFNWLKNFKTNSIDPGAKAIILQLIISENARYTKNPTMAYRKYAAYAETLKPEDYVMYNMNNVAASNSVLSGIGFERVKDKLATSVVMSKKNIKQNVSPLEQTLLM